MGAWCQALGQREDREKDVGSVGGGDGPGWGEDFGPLTHNPGT